MAWGREEKTKALKQVGKLTAEGMGAREAIRVVARGTGVPVRTIESWYWPKKRTKDDASPSKAALTSASTKGKDMGASIALFMLVKRLMEDGGGVTIESWDAGGTPVGVGEWVQEAKGRGHQDVVILGGVAVALYNEAVRLKELNAALELKLATQL